MRRGSRRASRRPLEVDSLEDRSLLSQFGWPIPTPMPVPPASLPVAFAFTQVSLPQVDHLQESIAARLPAGPWLQGLPQGGEFPVACGTVQVITGSLTSPGHTPGGESQMVLAQEVGIGFGLPFLKDSPLPPGAFEPGRRGPGDGPALRPGQAFGADLQFPGRLVAGEQPIAPPPFLAPDRLIPPPTAVRPELGPNVSERSNTPASQNSAEGISTLAGAEAPVAHTTSLSNQPVISFVSGIVVGFGQRIFASLVSLPLVQTVSTGPDSSAPITPTSGLPRVEVSYLPVTAPLEQHEPVPADVPSPEGADLITRFTPFDLSPIEQSFSRLVERIGSFDSSQELEANDVSPILLIIAGIAAIEASRRWQRRRLSVGSGQTWVIRRSAKHHPI